LSVLVDLEYENGFSISIDADLILGKSAYVHVKIVSLKGKARLQFTRHPFTHWSFSFIEVNDPIVYLGVISKLFKNQILVIMCNIVIVVITTSSTVVLELVSPRSKKIFAV
jgi:hypothetical protein